VANDSDVARPDGNVAPICVKTIHTLQHLEEYEWAVKDLLMHFKGHELGNMDIQSVIPSDWNDLVQHALIALEYNIHAKAKGYGSLLNSDYGKKALFLMNCYDYMASCLQQCLDGVGYGFLNKDDGWNGNDDRDIRTKLDYYRGEKEANRKVFVMTVCRPMIEPLATQKEDYMQVLNQFCNDLHNLDANLHTGSSDEKTISNAELRAQIRLQIADLIVTKGYEPFYQQQGGDQYREKDDQSVISPEYAKRFLANKLLREEKSSEMKEKNDIDPDFDDLLIWVYTNERPQDSTRDFLRKQAIRMYRLENKPLN